MWRYGENCTGVDKAQRRTGGDSAITLGILFQHACRLSVQLLQFFHVYHYLQRSSQLYSQTLDEGLVGQEKQGRPVYLLLFEHRGVVLAVRGALEELHDFAYGPGADVHGQTCSGKNS